MKPPQLRMQEQACSNCRYFRVYGSSVECLLLGRTLAVGDVVFILQSGWTRWCDGWKKLPKHWMIYAQKNPHWWDTYIPRTTLLKIRRRAGLLSKREYEREVERTGEYRQ